jgi:CRISPR-associated endonuclease/helicase Cas3
MILAKPTLNISLQEHTDNVISEARAVLASWPYVVDKYRSLTGKDLQKRVVTAATYHDVGKEHSNWQGACQKDHEIFQRTLRENDMFHLRNANFRHEIASLLDPKLGQLSDPVKVAIAAHHGKLAEDAAHRWEQHGEISLALWSHFKGIKNKVTRDSGAKDEKLRHAILSRYEMSGPRSLLQLADHRASARESSQSVPDWKSFEYTFPFDSKRGVQSLLDDFKDQPFTVLRAPTGSGKTDTALLWAQHQINIKRADRLVIAMPTRFTSNSLAVSVTKHLSQTGLYHSSAWFERTKNKTALSKEDRDWIVKEQTLARLFATPITVSTIDHLCISLTATREDHHAIFFNLAHSCVVIDESDFYDEFTELNIVVLLKVLRLLKVPVYSCPQPCPTQV